MGGGSGSCEGGGGSEVGRLVRLGLGVCGGGVGGELGEPVGIDDTGPAAASVAPDVHGGDPMAERCEVGHLVAPRVPVLWPTVDAEQRGPVVRSEHGDVEIDVAMLGADPFDGLVLDVRE